MINDDDREQVKRLERLGWDSLCDGTGDDFYGDLMLPDAVMVLSGGFLLDREGVIGSLTSAPTWDTYEIFDERLIASGEDVVTNVYRAEAHRDGQPTFDALMSSTYVRTGAGWRMSLYQQTPIEAS